jgi:hypothetical protein
LGALQLSVAARTFAFPRTIPLNAGIFARAPGNFVSAAIAIRGKVSSVIGKDAIAIGVSKRARPFVFAALVYHQEGVNAIRWTEMQRTRSFVVEGHSNRTAVAKHVFLRRRYCFPYKFPARVEVNASRFR